MKSSYPKFNSKAQGSKFLKIFDKLFKSFVLVDRKQLICIFCYSSDLWSARINIFYSYFKHFFNFTSIIQPTTAILMYEICRERKKKIPRWPSWISRWPSIYEFENCPIELVDLTNTGLDTKFCLLDV